MAAITWRNINGSSPAEAFRPLLGAQQSFGLGFDTLNKALETQQLGASNLITANRQDAVSAFKDAIAAAQTPEQLAQIQQSPELMARVAGMDALGRDAVRGFAMEQSGKLRSDITARNTFEDTILDRAETPVKDQVMSLAQNGKYDEAKAAIAARPELRGQAKLLENIELARQGKLKFEWLGNEERRKGLESASQIKVAEGNLAVNQGALANSVRATNSTIATAQQARDIQKWTFANTKDAKEQDDTANAVTMNLVQRQVQNVAAQRDGINALATRFQIPIDTTTGTPDFKNVPDPILAEFKKEADGRGLSASPSQTEALTELRATLSRQIKDPAKLEAAVKNAQAGLQIASTLGPEDQARLTQRTENLKSEIARKKQGNPFIATTEDRIADETKVYEKVDKLLTGEGEGTKRTVRSELGQLMNSGVTFKEDGKDIEVKVTPKLVDTFLARFAEKDSWIFANDTAAKMKEPLKDFIMSEEGRKLRKEAAQISGDYESKALAELRLKAEKETGTTRPDDIVRRLNQEIADRLSKKK